MIQELNPRFRKVNNKSRSNKYQNSSLNHYQNNGYLLGEFASLR